MTLPKSTPYIRFWLLLSAVYALLFIGGDFLDSPVSGWRGILTMTGHWGVAAFFASALWLAASVNRYVFLAASPLIMLLTAVALYYKFALGVHINPLTIELALVNNLTTWATVIDLQLMCIIGVSIIAGTALGIYRFRKVSTPRYALLWLLSGLAVTAAPVSVLQRVRNNVSARVPFNTLYNYVTYLQTRRVAAEVRPAFDNIPAVCNTDSLTVVVIIGESLRADHMSVNGYRRPTTPLLSATPNVVSLPRLSSPYAYTYQSVPYLLTRADTLQPDLADTEPAFISLFKKAGYRTAWIGNQDDSAPYAYFMNHCDTLINNGATKSIYGYESWLDTELLPHIDRVLAQSAPRQLLVLHTIGSHWWYRSHYTKRDARFKPETDSRVLTELSQQQMINSYDNTILASDRFWSDVISRLKDRRAVVLYVSDHGESLGEDGRYLHNDGAHECLKPAAFVWMSDNYISTLPEKYAALKRTAALPHDLDVVFHTALSLGNINTPALDPAKSLTE